MQGLSNYLWGLEDLFEGLVGLSIKSQSLFEGLKSLMSKSVNLKANFVHFLIFSQLTARFLHHSSSNFLKRSKLLQNILE